jgi:hypothetical protein
VGELGRLGGGNQWIVATSSEALLERAERSQIVSLAEAS